jgi:hypothetical protein
MNVYIINTKINHIKRYQIMTATQTGFNHVYPGKMFSLNDAIKLCGENDWTINAIGDIWHCTNK